MNNMLFEYMNKRIGFNGNPSVATKEPGPVITISRQTGCGASSIAWGICEELNKRKPSTQKNGIWRLISREILHKSAEQLNLDPLALQNVVNDKDRGIMDQIVEALSSHAHKSDQKILKTIHEVIKQFGNNGNVIIVGRGGARICNDIKLSLHIRIEAPDEWRIASVAKKLGFSNDFAAEYIRKHDLERDLLITKLFGRKPVHSDYDVQFNRTRFSEKEIVHSIIQLAIIKGLI